MRIAKAAGMVVMAVLAQAPAAQGQQDIEDVPNQRIAIEPARQQ